MNFELYNYKHALQQWRFLTNHLRRWMKNGHFESFSTEKKQQLATKLRHLYTQMLRFKTAASLRKAMGSCAVLLGLQLAPGSLSAQLNFAPPEYNPFGLQDSEQLHIDAFGDLDGDGDLDILSINLDLETNESVLQLRENESTNNGTTPNFLAPINVSPVWDRDEISFAGITLGDIDNDGDLDVLVGYYTATSTGLAFIENTGTASSLELSTYVLNPFGINPLEVDGAVPKLGDLDDDGDLDLMVGTDIDQYGNENNGSAVVFLENTGTPDAPAFGEPVAEPFGLVLDPSFSLYLELGDLDNDGDLDILLGGAYNPDNYQTDFAYFENTGSPTNPQFAAHTTNPFGLEPLEVLGLAPIVGDLDNDGDLDILNGLSYNADVYSIQWTYHENLLLDTRTFEPLTALSIRAYPTVSHDLVQLELQAETPLDGLRMSLYRYDGTLLQEQALPKDTYINQSLHLGAYPAGMYVLKIHTATGAWTQPLIKQ